jgi:hypothetical protein
MLVWQFFINPAIVVAVPMAVIKCVGVVSFEIFSKIIEAPAAPNSSKPPSGMN